MSIFARNVFTAKIQKFIANIEVPALFILSRKKDLTRRIDMKKDTHNFIQEYKGLGAFGLNRKTDEETIMFYLQKFSEDLFLKTILPRLSDGELEEIYMFVNDKLKLHISENEYHHLFLKDR
jgi:hypothetical protein